MHWLAHFLGLDSGTGPAYLFWSGIGADASELALLGAVLGAWRRHVCHSRHCWRIGRHTVDGTPWCDRHHQDARGGASGN